MFLFNFNESGLFKTEGRLNPVQAGLFGENFTVFELHSHSSFDLL